MLMKLLGGLSLVLGLLLFIFGPYGETKIQLPAYGNVARLLGLILMAAGVLMIKFLD